MSSKPFNPTGTDRIPTNPIAPQEFDSLLNAVRACTLCQAELPLPPAPVLQVHPQARILIAGQAPGYAAHNSGIPFDDPSGNRLRSWMGLDRETFYDPTRIAIVPMGFCYPGRGASGDRPPLARCAATWRAQLLATLDNLTLILVIGTAAQGWHLDGRHPTLTETVAGWRGYGPHLMPLPHPSPRNNPWLKRNAWFTTELLPELRRRVQTALQSE